MQFCCSIHFLSAVLNYLRIYFDMTNFFFLNMISYVLPFCVAFYTLMICLPCPTMAALVCNATLFVMLLVILFVSLGASGNIFGTLTQTLAFWPFLAAMSMLARIFVGQPDRQFHPLRHIPFLALL